MDTFIGDLQIEHAWREKISEGQQKEICNFATLKA